MDYEIYLKKELDKTVFIEIKEDLIVNMQNGLKLSKGYYPVMPEDIVELSKKGAENLNFNMLIKGMIYVIACDKRFKDRDAYIDLLKNIEGIENFIVMNIEKYKESDLKKALIYNEALFQINHKKEAGLNRVNLIIKISEGNNNFLEKEIVKSLEDLLEIDDTFAPVHYYLGEYYTGKDNNIALYHLRRAEADESLKEEAGKTLRKLEEVMKYDQMVELVKEGKGYEALGFLIKYSLQHEDDLDAKYYTAMALRQTGRYEQAIVLLEELIDEAERAEVYSEIGLCYALLKNFEQAIIYLKKGLKITPDDAGIISNLCACKYYNGDIEEALEIASLGKRLRPDDEIIGQWFDRIKSEVQ